MRQLCSTPYYARSPFSESALRQTTKPTTYKPLLNSGVFGTIVRRMTGGEEQENLDMGLIGGRVQKSTNSFFYQELSHTLEIVVWSTNPSSHALHQHGVRSVLMDLALLRLLVLKVTFIFCLVKSSLTKHVTENQTSARAQKYFSIFIYWWFFILLLSKQLYVPKKSKNLPLSHQTCPSFIYMSAQRKSTSFKY